MWKRLKAGQVINSTKVTVWYNATRTEQKRRAKERGYLQSCSLWSWLQETEVRNRGRQDRWIVSQRAARYQWCVVELIVLIVLIVLPVRTKADWCERPVGFSQLQNMCPREEVEIPERIKGGAEERNSHEVADWSESEDGGLDSLNGNCGLGLRTRNEWSGGEGGKRKLKEGEDWLCKAVLAAQELWSQPGVSTPLASHDFFHSEFQFQGEWQCTCGYDKSRSYLEHLVKAQERENGMSNSWIGYLGT